MENYEGKWGLYPWFAEHGESLIHIDDLVSFKELNPYGKVFYCEAHSIDYITIVYRTGKYRVKPELFKVIDSPKYHFSEKVKVGDKGQIGEVIDIHWHHKESRELYYLLIDGKRKSKRYSTADLKTCE